MYLLPSCIVPMQRTRSRSDKDREKQAIGGQGPWMTTSAGHSSGAAGDRQHDYYHTNDVQPGEMTTSGFLGRGCR